MMIMYEESLPILSCRPELPKELAAVVHRALAKDPEQRYADVKAMRKALERFDR